MSNEALFKLIATALSLIAIFYAGLYILAAIVPLFVLSWLIDQAFKAKYNRALADYRKTTALANVPKAGIGVRHGDDGVPMLGWEAVLPKGCYLEIYRLTEEAGASVERVREKGTLVLTTPKAVMDGKQDLFHDVQAPEGTLYYVPVVTGEIIEQRACEYSTFSFNSSLRFVKKVQPFEMRGHSEILKHPAILTNEPEVLQDKRSTIQRHKDEILSQLRDRKKDECELDEAIASIRSDVTLDEAEKEVAIEQLESRYEPSR